MADGDAQERTEKATPKKRSEARKKGQVAKSREVGSIAVLLVGLSTLCLFGSYMYANITTIMHRSFTYIRNPILDISKMQDISENMVADFITIVLPVMTAVVVIGIFSNVVQTGIMFTLEPMKPKFEKFNPIKGIGRLFSLQSVMEAFKSIAKLIIVGGVAYWTVSGEMDGLLALGKLEIMGISLYIFKVILKLFFRVCLAMVFLAAIDFAFQKWQFEKKLRMTKHEIKEEYKQTEGDPLIKSRIRKVQLEVAKKRMMQEVPEADVVVTNPVHLAVAIKYDRNVMDAPRIIAKGAEILAEKIKALAKEHNVPVVENKELAQNLYKAVEVGDEVPIDFYQTVAEVLAYVYRLKGKVA